MMMEFCDFMRATQSKVGREVNATTYNGTVFNVLLLIVLNAASVFTTG